MKPPLDKGKWCLILAALILCALLAGCIHRNSIPAICSLEVGKERVEPLGSSEIECAASDADGDSLIYTWSATGGDVSGQGPTVNWTAPASLCSYIISVKVTDGKGGEAMSQITVDVVEVNHTPVIESLNAEPLKVLESDTSTIKCIAYDPDGDKPSYLWLTSGGIFSGQGPTVNWTAPSAPGSYFVDVKVTDGLGGEATSQITVDVLVNHPPVIESVVADPSSVKQAKTATVKCIASDPDGDKLSYVWVADRGSISGQGPTISWTAPNTCGNCIVTVTVSDSRGKQVSQQLEIEVKAG